MLIKIAEFGIIFVSILGALVSISLIFIKNKKVEQMIYDGIGFVCVLGFLLLTLYFFTSIL